LEKGGNRKGKERLEAGIGKEREIIYEGPKYNKVIKYT
jgi:hypothetical protein